MAPKSKEAAIGEQCYRCDTVMDELCETVGGAYHCWSCADFLIRLYRYEQIVQQVRGLHIVNKYGECSVCLFVKHPCPTLRTLDGE